MYRKLKNILGVSLMVLAVLLAQIPMPEAQAEIENGSAVQQDIVQSSTVTVTFSMNGGNFYGTYNDYEFKNQFWTAKKRLQVFRLIKAHLTIATKPIRKLGIQTKSV